jgi:hypothetical protein
MGGGGGGVVELSPAAETDDPLQLASCAKVMREGEAGTEWIRAQPPTDQAKQQVIL